MQISFFLLLNTVIYNLIDAVAISIALIVLIRGVIHFVPIVDWDHIKKSPVASSIFLTAVILTFVVFSVVGVASS